MKNKTIGLLALALVISIGAAAQNAKEIKTEIKKVEVPAFQAEYNFSEDLMDKAIQDKFKKAGSSKPKKKNGYCKYTAVEMPELSTNKLDVYTKVKGKRDKASITMLVSTGYDNYISTSSDSTLGKNAINFLNNLNNDAIQLQAAIDLAAQQKALKEAKEKLADSEREKARLAKRKADLEKKLAEERKTQEEAAQKVEREKIRLENLKTGAE